MLNCSNRTIVFPPESTIPINLYLSSLLVDCCWKGRQGYILLSTSVVESDQRLNEILVIKEHPDVFPEDILDFPPEREIEFSHGVGTGNGTNIYSSI